MVQDWSGSCGETGTTAISSEQVSCPLILLVLFLFWVEPMIDETAAISAVVKFRSVAIAAVTVSTNVVGGLLEDMYKGWWWCPVSCCCCGTPLCKGKGKKVGGEGSEKLGGRCMGWWVVWVKSSVIVGYGEEVERVAMVGERTNLVALMGGLDLMG